MIGTSINQYTILEQLGEGGMGVVYLAEDTRLQRKVALKFISGSVHITTNDRKRFDREAQAAARLNHPNICTVYELGESENQTYIALEYVEGDTLKELIHKGHITKEDIRTWAAQMAKGLLTAHEQGVIHRDIKPANIMLTDRGHIKIMDFGIAKFTEAETELTRANSTIGTISYMSPEQARGEDVDHRTDIWALGVILYELTTGKRPFQGAFREAVMYAMMHQELTDPSSLNPDIEEEIEHIIKRCLHRNRDDRYDSLQGLLHDLNPSETPIPSTSASAPAKSFKDAPTVATNTRAQNESLPGSKRRRMAIAGMLALIATLAIFPRLRGWLAGSPESTGLPSAMHLAVLPFDTVSGSVEDKAFSSGLAHLVATNLMQMEHGKEEMWIIPVREVLSRGVTSASEAEESFGINLAISGTIVNLPGAIQISLDVTDALTLRVVASDVIEIDELDPSLVQEQVMRKLATMLGFQTPEGTQKQLLAGQTDDPEAYKLYIQAQGFIQRYEIPENVDEAIRLFELAIERDSTFALAYAGASFANSRKYNITEEVAYFDRAKHLNTIALNINDTLPEVLISAGRIQINGGDYERAVDFLSKAVSLAPKNYEAHRRLGLAHDMLTNYEEAEKFYKRAIELQPNYWDGYNVLGIMYVALERFKEGIPLLERVSELAPHNYYGFNNLGSSYLAFQDTVRAVEMLNKAIEIQPNSLSYVNLMEIALGRGDYGQYASYLEKTAEFAGVDYWKWNLIGNGYRLVDDVQNEHTARLKARDLAEERLEKVNANDPYMIVAAGTSHARLGNKDRARHYIDRYEQQEYKDRYIDYHMMLLYEEMGDRLEALSYLEKVLEAGLPASDIDPFPWLEELKADPMYKALIEKYDR